MSVDLAAAPPVGPAWTGALRAVAARLLRPDDGGAPAAVAVQGPGGTGKSLLLAELAAGFRAAGLPVTDVASAAVEQAEVAVLVDDGQRLTPEACRQLRELVRSRRARVVLAYRPWPHPPELTALVGDLGADRQLVVLGHLAPDEVRRWAVAELGPDATDELVSFVVRQTGGLPTLVDHLLRALAGRTGRPVVPGEVVDRVHADLAALADDERALLHALAAGAPLDADVLTDVLDVPPREVAGLVAAARAGGLLLGTGAVVPVVRDALLAATPADVTRSTRRRLVGSLLDRGEDALPVARALAADRVRDPRAAALLHEQGAVALGGRPELAAELLAEAAVCGAPVQGLAAERATAAALVGDLDGALLEADRVLDDDAAPGRAAAAAVAAAVLVRRGMLAHGADLYRLAGPRRAGSTALALVGLGRAEEAAAVLAAGGGSAPTLLSGSERLMAEGVLQSVRPGASGTEVAAALAALTRAATLLEPVGRTALLLDTPAALAALLALHTGELAAAEQVLDRALAADVGGPPCRPRHLLLRAWTAMLHGAMPAARQWAARAQQESPGALEPRDELYLRALEVGLARRDSDEAGLAATWESARQALLRHPIDLFTLLPLGELLVAAQRLADGDRLDPHLAEARALLHRLGEPPVWAAALHWSGVQAAILADQPAALAPHATALVAAARTSHYAATVAAAGRCWLRLLAGEVDAAAAVAAAHGLAAVGLAWDGSRLAGQAAVRAVEARDRTDLLHCARALAAGDDATPAPAAPAATGTPAPGRAPISQREREVAELVVAGLTYREIGSRLYISAKTVEHHVSRMRHRLGAGTRSELLARLRAELADGG